MYFKTKSDDNTFIENLLLIFVRVSRMDKTNTNEKM